MQNNALQTPKRRGRGCLPWLGGALVLVLALVLVGTVYESRVEASDARAYPAAGQMVDVGGYRLHITCTGAGSPTVVIDAGLGDWSLSWSGVQQGVARTTRACAYDRAGMGYSEAGPLPRDAEQMAKELHTLLDKAGIPGPYVLVGHSLGGLPVRVYAHEYPAQVAGVVLIESMSPGQAHEPATAGGSKTAPQANGLSIPSIVARFGVLRLFARVVGLVPNIPSLSPEARQAYAAFAVTQRAIQAWGDEGASVPASLAEAGAVKSFGDLPLIVLTASRDQGAGWGNMQAELLQLSSNSRQLIADKSAHNIHIEQPDAAIGAIVQMVEQLRQAGKK